MKKAILIDSAAREVRAVEVPDTHSLKALQGFVGGYITTACHLGEDVLFVDDEGLMKGPTTFFVFKARPDGQPLAGNGVIVGPESYDEHGDFTGNNDVHLTVEQVRKLVTFLDLAEFRAWANARRDRAASRITMIDKHGREVTEVLRTWGEMSDDIPDPPEAA